MYMERRERNDLGTNPSLMVQAKLKSLVTTLPCLHTSCSVLEHARGRGRGEREGKEETASHKAVQMTFWKSKKFILLQCMTSPAYFPGCSFIQATHTCLGGCFPPLIPPSLIFPVYLNFFLEYFSLPASSWFYHPPPSYSHWLPPF